MATSFKARSREVYQFIRKFSRSLFKGLKSRRLKKGKGIQRKPQQIALLSVDLLLRVSEQDDANRCDICNDREKLSKVINLQCEHRNCVLCLQKYFLVASEEMRTFPPICCGQPIAIDLLAPYLETHELEFLRSKQEEFETINRTYCSRPRCNLFISPKNLRNGKAKCDRCGTLTCEQCKAGDHEGECQAVADAAEARELIQTFGEDRMKQCFKCKRVIELVGGCFHVT